MIDFSKSGRDRGVSNGTKLSIPTVFDRFGAKPNPDLCPSGRLLNYFRHLR